MGFLNENDSLACFQILWELSSGLSLIAIVVGFSPNFWFSPLLVSFSRPNIIQQDIHQNIRLAGNSPAGYLAGTILSLIVQKIKHYHKNEYIWHNSIPKASRISIFHYSKSMSHENSKCLYFASVQIKHLVQKRPFFSHSKQNEKSESYLT